MCKNYIYIKKATLTAGRFADICFLSQVYCAQ